MKITAMDQGGDWLEDLESKGCGAYVGRAACGAPTDGAVFAGQVDLLFSTYRSAHIPAAGRPTVFAVLCLIHKFDIWADADPELKADQLREAEKYKELLG